VRAADSHRVALVTAATRPRHPRARPRLRPPDTVADQARYGGAGGGGGRAAGGRL